MSSGKGEARRVVIKAERKAMLAVGSLATGMLDLLESLMFAGFAISETGRVVLFNAQAEKLVGKGLTSSVAV